MAKNEGRPLTWKEAREAAERTQQQAKAELKAGKISRREYWEGKR